MRADTEIINKQLKYFQNGKAGCVFAAIAARDPKGHGWYHYCVSAQSDEVDKTIEVAIVDERVSTCSLVFADVTKQEKLIRLINELQNCRSMFLEQKVLYDNYWCLGFRVRLPNETVSWVSGFGKFDFFPKTRRAPYSEITFRVKPRPPYQEVMKPAPRGIVHLADMKMKIKKRQVFQDCWNQSFVNTEKILGHKPDLRSAAKTTFSVPSGLLD